MDLFYLTMFISFTAYFYIGSYYEEKKMVRMFGDDYTKLSKESTKNFPILNFLVIPAKGGII